MLITIYSFPITFSIPVVLTIRVEIRVDPDQMALLEASYGKPADLDLQCFKKG